MLRKTGRSISSHPNIASNNGPSGSLPSSPAMRRRRKESECMLKLERVLGLTSNKPMILSVNSAHDLVAYAAGCVVVLYNHKLNKQVGLLCSATLNKAPSSSSGDGLMSASGPGSYHSGMHGPGGSGIGSSRGIASLGGSPRAMAGTQWMNNPMASANINSLAGLAPMSLAEPSSSFGASNPSSNKNVKPKPISCLSFSPDGQFLAIGETGHQPRILIWEVASQSLVGELQGHKFGVQAVQFSPNSKFVVSLGFQHDGYIHVWNWRTNTQIASNKVTSKVNALAFSADGSYFVTAGLRHIKFWYLNVGANKRAGSSSTRVLDGRSGILGELRDSSYVDVVCSQDGRFTYAITSNGVLCLFSEGRIMEKWIDLHVRGAYSINLEERCVICACTDGFIRLFEPETLQYIVTLPKPSPVGTFGIATHRELQEEQMQHEVIADVLASQFDASSSSLICIYSDRSIIVWNLADHKNAVISISHHFHSDCVWGVEMVPELATAEQGGSLFPPETFATYSADGSILFWNLDDNVSALPPPADSNRLSTGDTTAPPHAHKEIIRVLYADENCRSWIQSPETQDAMDPGYNIVPLECGVRTVKISPDGKLLASGDKGGNLRVHSLSTLEKLTYQEAHDTEILAIDFTDSEAQDSSLLVATAGRDRLLHIFDVQNDYALVQTLDDHSSSITCIKFAADGSRMMSCGADKSIIFRHCQKNDDGMTFQPYHQAPGRASFYDMALHGPSQTMSVVSGDRRFSVYALESGKSIHTFKAETKGNDLTAGMAEACSMTHLSVDPSGTIAAASGSDKSVRIYDLLHGTCLAHMIAHSELVTSVKFANGLNRIISTSADGCVLVWRLSKDIVRRIQTRILENVTLPSYLQTKAAEKLSIPSSSSILGVSSRPLKIKKSTDRLAYASDYSNASRRNSTTSLMSDDFDLRSDVQSDDLNPSQLQQQRLRNMSQDFTPVSVTKPTSARTAGTRTRTSTASSVRTPLTRSRQNSTSQPVTPKSNLSSSRSTVLPELPPWNKNIVKEKVVIPSSALSSQKPTGPTSPRQRVTKSIVKGKWLPTPTNSRPRAISLGVPNEKSLISSASSAQEATEQQERHALSDHTPRSHSGTTNDVSADDDELSDETEPEFDDRLGFVASGLCLSPVKDVPDSDTRLKADPERASTSDSAIRSTPRITDSIDSSGEPVHAAAAGVETEDELVEQEAGGSEERDGDDEEADDDESVIDSASDHDGLSPLQSRFRSPDMDIIGPLEVAGSFEEGERLRSPGSGPHSVTASPLSRRASLKPAEPGRRSLSAKFLTAHAAAIMLGLTRSSMQERDGNTGAEGLQGGTLLELSSTDTTPTLEEEMALADTGRFEAVAADADSRPTSSSHSAPTEANMTEDREYQPLSLGERLNPISLNSLTKAVMRRRARSSAIAPSSTLSPTQPHIQGDTVVEGHSGSTKSQGAKPSGSGSEDLSKEVERTRRRLQELGYLGSPTAATTAGFHGPSSLSFVLATMSADKTEGEQSPIDQDERFDTKPLPGRIDVETRPMSPPHLQPSSAKGILTSPAHVTSPAIKRKTSHSGLVVAPPPFFGQTDSQARAQASLDMALAGIIQSDRAPPLSNHHGSIKSKKMTTRGKDGSGGEDDASLKDAIARISFLISHKAKSAMVRLNAGDDGGAENLAETQAWMKETRDGLLKLVGEAQGHLWTLEQAFDILDLICDNLTKDDLVTYLQVSRYWFALFQPQVLCRVDFVNLKKRQTWAILDSAARILNPTSPCTNLHELHCADCDYQPKRLEHYNMPTCPSIVDQTNNALLLIETNLKLHTMFVNHKEWRYRDDHFTESVFKSLAAHRSLAKIHISIPALISDVPHAQTHDNFTPSPGATLRGSRQRMPSYFKDDEAYMSPSALYSNSDPYYDESDEHCFNGTLSHCMVHFYDFEVTTLIQRFPRLQDLVLRDHMGNLKDLMQVLVTSSPDLETVDLSTKDVVVQGGNNSEMTTTTDPLSTGSHFAKLKEFRIERKWPSSTLRAITELISRWTRCTRLKELILCQEKGFSMSDYCWDTSGNESRKSSSTTTPIFSRTEKLKLAVSEPVSLESPDDHYAQFEFGSDRNPHMKTLKCNSRNRTWNKRTEREDQLAFILFVRELYDRLRELKRLRSLEIEWSEQQAGADTRPLSLLVTKQSNVEPSTVYAQLADTFQRRVGLIWENWMYLVGLCPHAWSDRIHRNWGGPCSCWYHDEYDEYIYDFDGCRHLEEKHFVYSREFEALCSVMVAANRVRWKSRKATRGRF
ncbi:mitogen-activated protein kinase binding protein 1 [Linnemannia schmuckeri]|uniref:Mitogen-activated protein kinase binding protein 1 n=1 Tax=Linnemannia schmuckeri TaxID=64567 RepID=A0A9P5RT17_9FUNG|nr:mitogen-activated protein kinase binding protein 1 [Linnemannia schmuckeri]